MKHGLLATLLAMTLLISTVAPVGAIGTLGGESNANAQAGTARGGVNVTIGQQLSTVMVETDSDVRSEVEETAFEVRFESRSDDERAEAIEERAGELAERAIEIREDYVEATRAHEAGEIDDSEYAERVASLNARAEDLAESVRRLRGRAAGVSALELRAAGFTAADLRAIDERLDAVTGTGARALLQRFTGRSSGEVRIETSGGLSIEVESEDGEFSREIERSRDDDQNITVAQADAFATARAELGSPTEGRWTLEKASVHDESGYYKFEFALRGVNASGEAEIRVDGSSGDVFRLETEIESLERDDDDDERDEEDDRDDDEQDHDEDDLALLVSEGTPRPNETVTLLALADGEPVAGATVTLDDREIGTTDANGTIAVTLPAGEVELEVTSGDAEGKLEFEFEFDETEVEDEELRRHFDVRGSIDGGTVTVHVTYDGTPVSEATVSVDGRQVGTTDADGTVVFEADLADEDDLEVDVRKGAFAAELEFEARGGVLAHVETKIEAHEDEAEDRDEEDDHDDEQEDDRDEAEDDERETEHDDERTETDDHEADGELSIRIVDGAREPGATVTVAVTVGGETAADVPVFMNDEHVGDTDAQGRLDVTLPDDGRVELVAEHGDEDADVDFEFEDVDSGSDDSEETETESEEDEETETESADEDDEESA